MSGTIINPAIFYWMGLFDSIHYVSEVIVILNSCILGVSIFFGFVLGKIFDDIDKSGLKKAITILGICLAIACIGLIFCPSKETMIEMLVAKTATYENAEWTVETVKEAVDYIIQAVKTA